MGNGKKDLKDFLSDEIQKSGFPLEIEVSSILEDQKWVVLNNQPFRDPDEEELRSVDILAFHGPTVYERPETLPFGFSPRLVIECKKSSSYAWVFFTRPQDAKVFPMDGQVYDFPKAFSTKAYEERNSLSQIGIFSYEYYFNHFSDQLKGTKRIHYTDFDRTAIAYNEYKIDEVRADSPKKRETTAGRNEIFEAVNQLVKFQDFDVEESVTSPGRIRGATSPLFPVELSFLAVVFDGRLFEAVVSRGKPLVEERKHLLLHYIYRPRKSFNNLNFWIDVVKKEFFPDYLTKISQDISLMRDKVISERELLSRYLRKD